MGNVERKGSEEVRDPDLINAEIALRRAAKRAREEAGRAGGYVVVYRDGKIVKVEPQGTEK